MILREEDTCTFLESERTNTRTAYGNDIPTAKM
jgi:hypothetical protein